MKNILRNLIYGPPSEINKLIATACKTPRYQTHKFVFDNLDFTVPDFKSVAYQLNEIFIEGRMDFSHSNDKPVIIDCGANVGVSVIRFKRLFPESTVIAFEADPDVFNYLEKNLMNNNLSGVETINKAVWINDDEIEFGQEGADGGSIKGEGKKVKIPCVRLKSILEMYSSIQLLKIDIEGAEAEVLNDCRDSLNHVERIFVEYHSFKSEEQRLPGLLRVLSDAGMRYIIHSIGDAITRPFIEAGNSTMDIQLDIHAFRK